MGPLLPRIPRPLGIRWRTAEPRFPRDTGTEAPPHEVDLRRLLPGGLGLGGLEPIEGGAHVSDKIGHHVALEDLGREVPTLAQYPLSQGEGQTHQLHAPGMVGGVVSAQGWGHVGEEDVKTVRAQAIEERGVPHPAPDHPDAGGRLHSPYVHGHHLALRPGKFPGHQAPAPRSGPEIQDAVPLPDQVEALLKLDELERGPGPQPLALGRPVIGIPPTALHPGSRHTGGEAPSKKTVGLRKGGVPPPLSQGTFKTKYARTPIWSSRPDFHGRGASMKLDLGCGNKKDGDIGLDFHRTPAVDVQASLLGGLPFRDEVFHRVASHQVLEHLPLGHVGGKDPLFELSDEVWRIVKPGGIWETDVPYALSYAPYSDPTHRRFFVPETFQWLTYPDKAPYYPRKLWLPDRLEIDRGFLRNLRYNSYHVKTHLPRVFRIVQHLHLGHPDGITVWLRKEGTTTLRESPRS